METKTENQLPTPAMLIDLKIVERNLAKLADYCRTHNLKLRPHTKTHKSIAMAKRQLAHGATGLTVAKIGEAEVMREASSDLLLAYPALDAFRSNRVAELARECTIRVAIDSPLAADVLQDAAKRAGSKIGILVDLDMGFHRTGLQDTASAIALAQDVSKKPNLRFDGLFFYPGHLKAKPDPDAHKIAMTEMGAKLSETIDALAKACLQTSIVSGGSTPAGYQSHFTPELTEIRPGTYIYNDWNCAAPGLVPIEDCAAHLICTVISDAVPNKVVIDAGSKTLTSDRLGMDPEHGGFGHLPDYPEAKIVRLSEEHGEVDISQCARRPKLGERVRVIPNHICPCINLQDQVWVKTEEGAIEPLRVDARGKLN
jgi:D-serine deaminase-like pyridoxal phosphate-dependent protein